VSVALVIQEEDLKYHIVFSSVACTPKFVRRRQHNLMVGLTMSFNPQYNILITPTEKACFVCKLTIENNFDRLVMWLELSSEI
jgi:hypothetical protein